MARRSCHASKSREKWTPCTRSRPCGNCSPCCRAPTRNVRRKKQPRASKVATTASIIIEVDDKGATQAFQRVNAEAAKLGPALQPVGRVSEQTFNSISGGALR